MVDDVKQIVESLKESLLKKWLETGKELPKESKESVKDGLLQKWFTDGLNQRREKGESFG